MMHQVATRHTPDIKFIFVPTTADALAENNRAMMADVAESGVDDGMWAAEDPEESLSNGGDYVSYGVSLRRRPRAQENGFTSDSGYEPTPGNYYEHGVAL